MHTEPTRPESPLILLASDDPRLAADLHLALREQNFAVEFAPGYVEMEGLADAHEHAIVLLEVSRHQSVEAAVELALRIKRSNANRFVGYLADSILLNSGLAGDAIFPRNPHDLTLALRNHFRVV
ncbi:MAG: response regulator transcription factor [Acidobacteriaceae bacterium]|nr:response regulator transcription factor [Acidobacteriaceae bacterium]